MKPLHLILKRKWFEMIESGIKTEEYRDLSEYWVHRLCFARLNGDCVEPHIRTSEQCKYCRMVTPEEYLPFPFDAVTFQLGYRKDAPRMTFKVKDIIIGEGKFELGAPVDKEVFIIKLGKRI